MQKGTLSKTICVQLFLIVIGMNRGVRWSNVSHVLGIREGSEWMCGGRFLHSTFFQVCPWGAPRAGFLGVTRLFCPVFGRFPAGIVLAKAHYYCWYLVIMVSMGFLSYTFLIYVHMSFHLRGISFCVIILQSLWKTRVYPHVRDGKYINININNINLQL